MAGVLRYKCPATTRRVSDLLGMGLFTAVSRTMRFYDEAE
jgi:hypothetical protein